MPPLVEGAREEDGPLYPTILSVTRKWWISRLGNQMIRLMQGLQGRFGYFLAHRSTSLKSVQTYSDHIIVREQPPGDVHPFRAILRITFEWLRKEKPLIFFLIG